MSCNDVDTTKESQTTKCGLAIKKLEKCLKLSENSLSYVEKCGSEEVAVIESIKNCDELIEYINGKQ
jgi:hypothetical protein